MSNQEKFKKMQEATRARKAKDAGKVKVSSSTIPVDSSVLQTPPEGSSGVATPIPSATNSAAASPHREVIGEKRGSGSSGDNLRPEKSARLEGASVQTQGLHKLHHGIPAGKFVMPALFAHGGEVFDANTEVIIPEADQTIMTDMGPESLKGVIAESSMHCMKLMEVANFLNARERQFVEERSKMEKRMASMEKNYKKMEADMKKVRLDYEELGASYDAYKDKYQLQLELTQTLQAKEVEVESLSKEKENLVSRVAELEGKLQQLSIPDEEEKEEDPLGEFVNTSRGSLIHQLIDAQNSAVDMASSSFQNAVAQIQVLNAGIELKLDGLDECKVVLDGVIQAPSSDSPENPADQ
jgi:cell division protein FtsB